MSWNQPETPLSVVITEYLNQILTDSHIQQLIFSKATILGRNGSIGLATRNSLHHNTAKKKKKRLEWLLIIEQQLDWLHFSFSLPAVSKFHQSLIRSSIYWGLWHYSNLQDSMTFPSLLVGSKGISYRPLQNVHERDIDEVGSASASISIVHPTRWHCGCSD